jgi:hypothetical protein
MVTYIINASTQVRNCLSQLGYNIAVKLRSQKDRTDQKDRRGNVAAVVLKTKRAKPFNSEIDIGFSVNGEFTPGQLKNGLHRTGGEHQ